MTSGSQLSGRPGSQLSGRPDTRVSPARHGGTHEVALIDLLDRLLQGGVTIQGDITLSAAGIDLVELDLRVLVAAVDKVAGR
ncbi:MAG TPA: gas vesicle protein [Solirubrobacteraceae bacterium]|nr:gas vesicle protein [Solirubrobacteraceae bacterium]